MKNSRMKIAGVLMASALALTGCGEAVYTMTPEEEAAVVSYAVHVLSKYNKYQADGEVPVAELAAEPAGTEIAAGGDTAGAAEEPQDLGAVSPPEAVPPAETEEPTFTLNEALDLGPIQADFVGADFTKNYVDTDAVAIDAPAGKQFLAVHINLTNQSEQALHINILSMTPTFVIQLNDSVKVPAQTTIMLNDLSTFQGDIAAGEIIETVLLFQVSEEITEASSMQLKVTMNGNNYAVNL